MSADSDTVRAPAHEDQRLGELLGVVHDLRQPLAAMRFALSLVRGRVDLPGDVQARLDQLDGHATWMTQLLRLPGAGPCLPAEQRPVRGVGSDAGLAEAGLAELPAVDLEGVALAAAAVAGQARPGRLVLESSGPVAISVGETELRRALGNLLDNAFRAAGPTGTVLVRVGSDDQVGFVSVDDDGPGFGRGGSGSGLGLSVVAQVAVSVGGRLEITSSDMGGASVTLRMPVHSAARARALT